MTDTQNNQFQAAGRVKTIQGSILSPHNAGLRFILNIANTAGKMESPLYPVFDKKWPKVKAEVRGSFVTKTGAYKLGTIACNTATQSDVWVLSLLAQDDDLKTDVVALEKSLVEVCKLAKFEKASVHVSTILTDHVPQLTELINKCLVKQGVSVNFYDEPGYIKKEVEVTPEEPVEVKKATKRGSKIKRVLE
jgi:hypothetical protein